MGSRIGLGLGLWPGSNAPPDYLRLASSLSPELWLRVNGNANDSSGKGRNGTLVGAPALTAPGPVANLSATCGKFIKASGQYISVPNFTAGFNAFSFWAWVKPIALASLDASGGRVFSQRSSATGWTELFVDQNGDVMLFDGGFSHTIAAAGTCTDGTWALLAGTITGPGGTGCTPYVNGVAQAPVSWANNTDAGEFDVGRLQLTAGNFANFWLAEVYLTQQLVSAAQHLAVYNLTKRTRVTATVTAVANKARFVFTQATASFNGLGDFSAFKVNASGGGLVSPTAATSVNGTTVDFTYASAVVSTNAWQVNDEPPASAISFGPTFYLKAPMSGTAA